MENKVYQKPELKIYEVEIANLLSVSNPTLGKKRRNEALLRTIIFMKIKKHLYEKSKFFIFMHPYCDSFILF